MMTAPSKQHSNKRDWRAMWGCHSQALSLYRISLGSLLTCELVLRFRFLHPFYSNEGTLPLNLLLPHVDELYETICIHCWFGSVFQQQLLLGIQVACSILFALGINTRCMAFLSWWLYLSLTLRNTWLNFILDRYFHYLLLYAIFLPPLDQHWTVRRRHENNGDYSVNLATICLKLQVLWIYFDAGYGKLTDPLGGWTYNADPLPALDTYARHTVGARYMYALLTPAGLRLLTPLVVWVELLATPVALLTSYVGSKSILWTCIALVWSLHVGIAATLRNTVLLSLVANCAYCVFVPPLNTTSEKNNKTAPSETTKNSSTTEEQGWRRYYLQLLWTLLSSSCIVAMVSGSLWFELWTEECNQSMKHIWSTLLHNRWNVFVGAEEYVTWEIAPGLLADNSTVVDVWSKSWTVEWSMPGTGAPCTSTSRPGRWRSFPYLAGLEGIQGEALWGYLCNEWDQQQDVSPSKNQHLHLTRYNFFMLQADVLPNMGFSQTRKRLIHSHQCKSLGGADVDLQQDEERPEEEKESSNGKGYSSEL